MSLTNEECSQLLDEIKIREARKNVGKYLKNKIEYDELYETLDKIFPGLYKHENLQKYLHQYGIIHRRNNRLLAVLISQQLIGFIVLKL